VESKVNEVDQKVDGLTSVVTETRIHVAEMRGKLDVLPQLVDAVRDAADRVQEREHVRVMTDIQVDGAQKLEAVKTGGFAKRSRWKIAVEFAKLLGVVAGAGGAMELIHWL